MAYKVDFEFYSPTRQHSADLLNLRVGAQDWGIGCELRGQQVFRNWQRFGINTTQSFLRFTSSDRDKLQRFVNSIEFS